MLKGYYLKSWECSASNIPSGTNTVVYFSGWSDVNNALEESNECKIKAALGHTSYLSFGGGNANGRLTAKNLAGFTDAINAGKLSGYKGIAIDAEEGDGGIESSYDTLISAAKNKGLAVLVTISHSAPYNVPDSETLMSHLIKNKNIDFISPQLYSSGEETANEYELTDCGSQKRLVTWNSYAASSSKFAPSIVSSNLYSSATSYFAGHNVTTNGYVVWK